MIYLIVVIKNAVPIEYVEGELPDVKRYAQELANEHQCEVLISQAINQGIRIKPEKK